MNSETEMLFKTKPFDHQIDALERSRNEEYYALFMEMGTGKSKVIIDNAMWLWGENAINGLLILAPKGAYLNWLYNEIPTHFLKEIPSRLGFYGANQKKEDRLWADLLLSPKKELDIMCVNLEGLISQKCFDFCKVFLNRHSAMMVIDESVMIKTPKAKRTKRALSLGRMASYRRILSGAPITNNPFDIYSQTNFLKHGLLGFTSFLSFKHYYADIEQISLGPTRPSYPVVKEYRHLDELSSDIDKFSFRVLKKDCLDLPEKVYEKQYVELTKPQKKAYTELKDFAVTQFEKGGVTVTSAMTLIGKLHRITCGHIKTDEGEVIEIETNRKKVLFDIIEGLSGKAIIWCNYRKDIEMLKQLFKEKGMLESYVTYWGDTPDCERALAVAIFQDDPACKIFLGTAQTGGRGITLTAASTVIYYSNSYNLETRIQSEDRAHRIGQKNNVTYIDLVSRGTVDEKIIKCLKEKKVLADSILDDWRDVL